jgi:two-component system, sensor histidine kinase and response regulator
MRARADDSVLVHITGWGAQYSAQGVILAPVAPAAHDLVAALRSVPGCSWSEVDASGAQVPVPLAADIVVAAPVGVDAFRWVLTEFRANWQRELVPLVLVVPEGEPDLALEAYERGTDYVVTPADSPSFLCARVRGLLHLRTVVRLLFESRNRAKDRLEQHERWARFLVHDLRGPLSSLTLGLTTLKTAPGLSQDDRGFVGELREELGRLSALVGNLLDHERLQTGALKPKRRPLDLVGLLDKVVQRARLRGSPSGIQVRFSGGGRPMFASLDLALVERVLENLLRNAVTYSPAGSPVDVELTEQGAEATVAILNSGPPIPAEMRESIFEPYVQVGPADSARGGLGLGLAFCREVVAAHGGAIQATERDGRTCFLVRIPR